MRTSDSWTVSTRRSTKACRCRSSPPWQGADMFKFSLRTEYGLRALMELASRWGEGPVPAREIAESQNIPLRFLEHQLATLHKGGIVVSHRGVGGGTELARDPSEICLSQVIEVLEGP